MSTVTTTITELPESRVRLDAEVAPDEVERRIEQAARKLGRSLRIDGFRKGKVPPQVVIRRLGRAAVLDEALREALGAWYVDALEEAGVVTIGSPDLDVGELPERGQPLAFSIEIGVRPKAQLGEYKGLEVGKRGPQVTEEAVDAQIEQLRERSATLETVERAAENGDHVVIDYIGRIDGEAFAGGEGRDQLLELGSGRLIPGFEEQLVGATAGASREVSVRFPDDYSEALAGKQAVFDVTVSEVKAKRLPELDDDFASEASEFDTLAELRDDIGAKLREHDERAVEREFETAVLDAAVEAATIEVPDQLAHARAHEMLEETLGALSRQGISKDAYLRITGKNEEELAHEAEPEAASALRREAVLAAVVDAEQIVPTDDDVREALAGAAEDGEKGAEKMFEQLKERGRLERMRDDLAERKALELLVSEAKAISIEQARAREKLWTPDRPAHPADEPGKSASGKLWTPGS
jgi:trigger factor